MLASLFFLSGVSGLVYQVVWMRMLIRTFGVGVYAVTTVVAIFMAGLAGGSLLVGRWSRTRRLRLLMTYGYIEIAVAVIGALSSVVMGSLPETFQSLVALVGYETASVTVLRVLLSAVVLLPPTVLMGATLPLLSGHLAQDPLGAGARAGLLYGVNTLGAVAGVLGTGFFSLAVIGETRTILVGASLNLVVGVVAIIIARRETAEDTRTPTQVSRLPDDIRRIFALSALSGFCALSFEVIWSRILSVLLGNSVYGFSSMLGAYLLGIGVGSAVMSRYVGRIKSPLVWFAGFEIANALMGIATLHVYRAIGSGLADSKYGYALLWDLGDFGRMALYACLIVLPVTLIYGAIFPVVSRLVANSPAATEDAIGKLYGINTIGGIAGSLVTGFFLIPAMGTLLTFLTMSVVSFGVGAYLLGMATRLEGFARPRPVVLATSGLLVLAVGMSFEDPFLSVLKERVETQDVVTIAHDEDRGATVTFFEAQSDGTRVMFVNGLYVSNTAPRIGEMMLNVPLAYHPDDGPKKVLVVGLGVGAMLKYAVEVGHEITIVELHPVVVDMFRRLNEDHQKYLQAPNVRIVQADGRNHLLHTEEKYDLILVDGSPPVYASGMVNLYSLQFAQMAKAHLREHGIFAVWFPVVCFERDLWSVVRNFAETFPAIQLYSQPIGANAIILGSPSSPSPFELDFETFAQRMARWNTPGLPPWADVNWGGIRFDEATLRKRAAAYPLVTDDRPYTEFPLQPFLRGEPYYADNAFLYPKIAEQIRARKEQRRTQTSTTSP